VQLPDTIESPPVQAQPGSGVAEGAAAQGDARSCIHRRPLSAGSGPRAPARGRAWKTAAESGALERQLKPSPEPNPPLPNFLGDAAWRALCVTPGEVLGGAPWRCRWRVFMRHPAGQSLAAAFLQRTQQLVIEIEGSSA